MFAHKARVPKPAGPAPEHTTTPVAPVRQGDMQQVPLWAQRHERDAETRARHAAPAPDAGARASAAPPGSGSRQGRPLDRHTQAQMSAHFGTSFEDVRVHTGPEAAASARAIHARAYTSGSDIVFADGQHQPDTSAGQRLIAHELAHVVQQRTGAVPYGMVQRAEDDDTQSETVTVKDIFPYQKGDRIEIKNVMDFLTTMAIKAADESGESAAMLQALQQLTGVVEEATADLFIVKFTSPITIPGQGDESNVTYNDARLKLERAEDGTFGITVSGKKDQAQQRTVLLTQSGLKATKDSEGNVRFDIPAEVGISGAEAVFSQEAGKTTISAELKANRIKLFQVKQLKSAEKATSEQERDVQQVFTEPPCARRQQFSLGFGAQYSSSALAPTLSAAWRYNFPTTSIFSKFLDPTLATILGESVQIPLEAQILYAPPKAAVGAVSTGVNVTIPDSLKGVAVPINIRLISLGLGGGELAPDKETGEKAVSFGPTVGAGAGVVLSDWVLLEVRYDRLFNLLPEGQSAHFFQAGIGAKF